MRNNYANNGGPGQWDGPGPWPGYQTSEGDGALGWVIAILGVIGLAAFVIYVTPPLLLTAGVVIVSWVVYQSIPVYVEDNALERWLFKSVLHHLYALAAIACVVAMLILYPFRWYSLLLALLGLVIAISDLFSSWLITYEPVQENMADKMRFGTNAPHLPQETMVYLGIPLSDLQLLMFSVIHACGYLSLIVYYLSVVYASFRQL